MIIDLAVGKDGDVLDSHDAKKGHGDRGAWKRTKTWCSAPGARPSDPSTMSLVGSPVYRPDWTLS